MRQENVEHRNLQIINRKRRHQTTKQGLQGFHDCYELERQKQKVHSELYKSKAKVCCLLSFASVTYLIVESSEHLQEGFPDLAEWKHVIGDVKPAPTRPELPGLTQRSSL